MGGRARSKARATTSHASEPFRFSETIRRKELLLPEEVAELLRVTRKYVFGLPIRRYIAGPKKILYRVQEVEAYLERGSRPQAVGFLFHASHHMNRDALTPANVAKILRMRRASAVKIMAPHRRISVSDLERLVLSMAEPPAEG